MENTKKVAANAATAFNTTTPIRDKIAISCM